MNNDSGITMHSRHILAISTALVLLAVQAPGQPASPGAPTEITLGGSIELALKNNERVLQYQERSKQKSLDDLGALGNFLPNVSLTGSYVRLNSPIQIDLEPVRQAMIALQAKNMTEYANIYTLLGGGSALNAQQRAALTSANSATLNAALPPFVETFKDQNFPTATWTVIQPLFLGGKLLAAKAYASSEERGAACEEKHVRNEVTQEAAMGYFSIVLLDDVIRTRREVLAGMRRHQADARRLKEEGLIPLTQVLRADVAVAEAERNLSDDLNRRALAALSFRQMTGLPEDTPLDIRDSLSNRILADTLERSYAASEGSNPIVQLLAEKKIAATQKYRAERAAFLPQVAAFGKYEMYPQYLSALEPRWTIGVQVSFNVFHGFKDYAAVASASHLESEVEHLQTDTRQKIHLLVRKCVLDAENARARYSRENTNVALARENLRVTEGRFLTGLGTSLDLIDAELSLEKSVIEREQSMYEYLRALTGLYGATGSPEEIVELWNQKGA
jgi:outer membrane protein TolC